MAKWLFSHRRREAQAAWDRYRSSGAAGPRAAEIPPLFEAGFHMGVGVAQRAEPSLAPEWWVVTAATPHQFLAGPFETQLHAEISKTMLRVKAAQDGAILPPLVTSEFVNGAR